MAVLLPKRFLSVLLAGLGIWVLTLRVSAAEVPGFTGFTRPGLPSDSVVEGKIIQAIDEKDPKKNAFGGTVYFMVLERMADGTWNSGLKDFASRFRPGIDFNASTSPDLDSSAKYLYLYQVVNDRRTLAPIESTSIKLLVEMSEITSWGYFHGVGFATGGVKEGEKVSPIRPVSFSHVLAAAENERAYRSPAKPILAPDPFRLTRVPTLQGEAEPMKEKGQIITIIWDALDPATNPDYVMMLEQSEFEDRPAVRAIWSGKNALIKGGRSTVFGFTSNLPPTLEPVKIRTPRQADGKEDGKILPVVEKDKIKQALGDGLLAEGRVPTPRPETTQASYPPALGPLGGPGLPPPGAMGGGGGGFGFPGFPAGGIGSARASLGGSGFAGGTGGGTSTTGQNQNQQPRQTGQQIINFNVTLTNQQDQNQTQFQKQNQSQNQQGNGGHVIPEPGSWLLAFLGLPALLFWASRRPGAWLAPLGR